MSKKLRIGHPRNGKDSLTRLWVKFYSPSLKESYVYFSRDWRSATSQIKNKDLGISRLIQNIIINKRGKYAIAILYDNYSDEVISVYDSYGNSMSWKEFSEKKYRKYPVGKDFSLSRLWVRFKEKKTAFLHKTFTYYSNDIDVLTEKKELKIGIRRFEKNILQGVAKSRFLEARLYSNTTNQLLIKYDQFCLLYTSPSPRDRTRSRMPSSA